MKEHQIEKPGNENRSNILGSSNMKFYPIWSRGCGEMASDRRTTRRTDGWTDEAATICSPFWKHINAGIDCKTLTIWAGSHDEKHSVKISSKSLKKCGKSSQKRNGMKPHFSMMQLQIAKP